VELALAPHDLTDLPSVLQVLAGLFGLGGAVVGFFLRAHDTRRLLENVALGFAMGAVIGTALAFAVWLAAVAGGA
jgi:ABC-type nitrate/sulfonate/bicarbonate transport system permease component